MNRKLTLLLDEKIIKQAKRYAVINKESLSGMVEKYFKFLSVKTTAQEDKEEIPKEIEEMIGIISIPDSLDVKAEYRKHRTEKITYE